MSSLELAVEGCTLKVVAPATGGTFVILPIGGGSLGSSAKCQTKQVYTGINFTVTGVAAGSVVSGTGAGMISGSATKVKMSGTAPVRRTDSTNITVTDANPPFGTASVTVEVYDAGQTKAKVQSP